MTKTEPETTLDTRFSEDIAQATPWAHTRRRLQDAELFWISTVRPDGRPHVTPLLAVWADETLYFCTGPEERKALNLAHNPHVAFTTGTNTQDGEPDVVLEGTAVRVTDDGTLRRLADAWVAKYGEGWRFDVHDGGFHHSSGAGHAWVFGIRANAAFAFAKSPYGQTRYRF
ncbi:pyridoxamine 5'-phosphate oxidase family protein [Phytoactinopolyspora halotolerans]|uniref:Pyridoxamine 5'-phosphate oxidase family protein n=1 Tax=Phytoactinopolyspora halotolerans TaxID=1981512 RepID=A0A6L9SEC1_9ACTN|nr:pyridoxamine 5'-phosphate oxidase family protein [Phytoactinopolyspora halotolerans]NEE03399.1 pyridoxamine 5'-phosphate oxidase family protein [Phytoactinopolyspora halotolerans]